MRFPAKSLLLCILLLAPVVPAASVGLPAGTQITIVTNASFVNDQEQVIDSAPASVTMSVMQIPGVSVKQVGHLGQATPGQDIYIPITVTNMGNAPDVFTLSVSTANHWNAEIIYDDNADGSHQQDEQWSITMAGPMIADGYTPCFAKISVPGNASACDTVTLTAVSNSDGRVSDSVQVRVDTVAPPSVKITAPTDESTYIATSTSVNLGGTAAGGLDVTGVTWSTDHGTSGTCTGTTQWTASSIGLQSGSNVVTITATDSASRTATATLTVVYDDTELPTVAITDPVNSGTYTTDASQIQIAGTASDNVGVKAVSWSNDRGGSGDCTGTTAWSTDSITLASGQNVITITATDAAGNAGISTLTVTYAPDPLIPTVNIVSPTSSPTYTANSPALSIAGTASDSLGIQTVAWSSDRGYSGACSGTTSWSASGITLLSGDNVITVTATNTSGKTSTDVLEVTYAGQHAPVLSITSPTASPTYSTSSTALNIAGTAAHDAGIASVTWSNFHVGSGSCTGTDSWSAAGIPLKAGTNVITITAASTLGDTATATLTVTCTAPTVTITAPTSAAVYATERTSVDLGGTATGAVASVAWSNNRGASGVCSGKAAWTANRVPLALGQNVITVTASDAGGHGGFATLTVTRNADTTKPAIAITSPADGCGRNCPFVCISGTASDNAALAGVTYINTTTGETGACAISGTTWFTYEVMLALGDNEIVATATDTSGNTMSATITVTYVDASPGAAWAGMAMVSLPIIPDDTDPKLEAGFLNNAWCTYLPATNSYSVYPDQGCWLNPADQTLGRGFWARFGSQQAVPCGTIPAQDQPVTIHLTAGWNLIGTPFISDVQWDSSKFMLKEPNKTAVSMRDAVDLTPRSAWGWRQNPSDPSTGDYYLVSDTSDTNKLEPWRAYWIRAFRDCDLIIPAPQ